VECESLELLTEMMQTWKAASAQLTQLSTAVAKSGRNLRSHVANLKRAKEREEMKQKKKEEQSALAEMRKRTAAAAQKVKTASEEVPRCS